MLLTEGSLRQLANDELQRTGQYDASPLLESVGKNAASTDTFDIFLSHSSLDKELVLGLVVKFRQLGHTTYVDWIVDAHLDRTDVSESAAGILRDRMKQCRSLFYATTSNSTRSKWMPWECGYFDGLRENVATCPVSNVRTEQFQGQEYLGLYPYVMEAQDRGGNPALWIHTSPDSYVRFESWLQGEHPKKRSA